MKLAEVKQHHAFSMGRADESRHPIMEGVNSRVRHAERGLILDHKTGGDKV